jgi:hypothetical protein
MSATPQVASKSEDNATGMIVNVVAEQLNCDMLGKHGSAMLLPAPPILVGRIIT